MPDPKVTITLYTTGKLTMAGGRQSVAQPFTGWLVQDAHRWDGVAAGAFFPVSTLLCLSCAAWCCVRTSFTLVLLVGYVTLVPASAQVLCVGPAVLFPAAGATSEQQVHEAFRNMHAVTAPHRTGGPAAAPTSSQGSQ
jgi:hypothetical protein